MFAVIAASLILYLPDVPDTHLLDGKDAAGGRLSLCQQSGLRAADAHDSPVVSVGAQQNAIFADEKVLFGSSEAAL